VSFTERLYFGKTNVKSNQINIFSNSSKEKKEIPLLKEWKVRNKLTTYTIPAHYATQTDKSL